MLLGVLTFLSKYFLTNGEERIPLIIKVSKADPTKTEGVLVFLLTLQKERRRLSGPRPQLSSLSGQDNLMQFSKLSAVSHKEPGKDLIIQKLCPRNFLFQRLSLNFIFCYYYKTKVIMFYMISV